MRTIALQYCTAGGSRSVSCNFEFREANLGTTDQVYGSRVFSRTASC